MSVVLTLLSALGFVVLTAGTALFVAAEFSLTALERSTVDAMSRLRRTNSHLALVTDADSSVVAMVALEDLVEDLVGTVRDGTHRV